MLEVAQTPAALHQQAGLDVSRQSGALSQQNLASYSPANLSPSSVFTPNILGRAPDIYSQSSCDVSCQIPSFIGQAEEGRMAMTQESFPSLVQQRLAMSTFTHQPIGVQLHQFAMNTQTGHQSGATFQQVDPVGLQTISSFASDSCPEDSIHSETLNSESHQYQPPQDSTNTRSFVDNIDVDSSNNSHLAICSPLYLQQTYALGSTPTPTQLHTPTSSSTLSSVQLMQPLSPASSFLDAPSSVTSIDLEGELPLQTQEVGKTHQGSLFPTQAASFFSTFQHSQPEGSFRESMQLSQHQLMPSLSSARATSSSPLPEVLVPNNEVDSFMTVEGQPDSQELYKSVFSHSASRSHAGPSSQAIQEQSKEDNGAAAQGSWQRRTGVFMAVHPFESQFAFLPAALPSSSHSLLPLSLSSTPLSHPSPASSPYSLPSSASFSGDDPALQHMNWPPSLTATSSSPSPSFPEPLLRQLHDPRQHPHGFIQPGISLVEDVQMLHNPALSGPAGAVIGQFGQTGYDAGGSQGGTQSWDQTEEQMDMS